MGKKGDFYRKLRDGVFGQVFPEQRDRAAPTPESKPPSEAPRGERGVRAAPSSTPRFWQIGFDFGTCFCKLVYRDVVVDKARVYIPDVAGHAELPFLIPSGVSFDGRTLRASRDAAAHYVDGRLYHLKSALEQVALENYEAGVLQPFREVLSPWTPDRLASLVEASAIYLLGGILGDVRRQIRLQDVSSLPRSAAESYIAVNMALPVADAERPLVKNAYQAALQTAWCLADRLSGHPEIELAELTRLVEQTRNCTDPHVSEACFVYPEVFANIQVFVRSRASDPGVYLFSDTGAGTVDQCIFHFIRDDGNPHTLYHPGPLKNDALHAAMMGWIRLGRTYLRAYSAFVLPLGSAEIERLAAGEVAAALRPQELEKWRKRKEGNSDHPRLRAARQQIRRELRDATEETLRAAGRKGWRPEELGPIRIVFGGGGHCRDPYAKAVRGSNPEATVVGLPLPPDLDLRGNRERWMSRLAVAYGLSFQEQELADFTYPNDLPDRPNVARKIRSWERPRNA